MAVLTTGGRALFAADLVQHPLHLAWGSGDPAWDADPVSPPISAAGLEAEIGRAALAYWAYVVPDALGQVYAPTGRFSESVAPTNQVLLRFDFGFDSAPDATIREVGVFADSVLVGGLPPGQAYFEPAEVSDAGRLIALERFAAVPRSVLVREAFDFVMTI